MARDFAKNVYNSTRWRKCAKAYAESRMYICERCGKTTNHWNAKGKRQRWIVHHKKHLTPQNITDDLLVYGWDNLEYLCIECHNQEHSAGQGGRRMMFDDEGNLIGCE